MSLATYLKKSTDIITLCTTLTEPVNKAIAMMVASLGMRKPLLVCGNGGSAADAQHITGELVGRFMRERKAYRAICLTSNSAVLTAWSNDYAYESVFSRQVESFGEEGGIVMGLSTSGNSKNVILAFEEARKHGMTTIALTGEGGGKLAPLSDILLDVPSSSTPLIQQAHQCLYHYICEKVEDLLCNEGSLNSLL